MSNKSNNIVSGSIFDSAHTTAKNQLGTKVQFADGREYIYVSTESDLAAGALVASPAASAVLSNAMAAASAGATEVTITVADVTANQYAEGYLMTTDDTGQAYCYRVKKNTASDTTITVTLYDPLIAAISTTTDCVLKPNQYDTTIIGTTETVCIGVGVVATTAATDGTTEYFWIQSKGPGVALVNSATSIIVGAQLMADTGGIKIADGTDQVVAIAASAAEDAAGFQPVILTM